MLSISYRTAGQTPCIDAINSLGDDACQFTLRRADVAKGNPVAKGHECPVCGKNTLHPYTTNQLKCSNCDTIVKKDRVS